MSKSRPSAWSLISVLALAILVLSVPAAVLGKTPEALEIPTVSDPVVACTPGELPTRWTDEFHPPNTVRVLRSKGPNIGRVETVNFWKYVGHVVRAEYSSSGPTPEPWMRMGALTVKQYAWYKALYWGGGRIRFLNPDGVTTTTQCYDLKDNTADQIYKDVKADPNNPGQWIPANVPTEANLKAMRETWHVTLRKWLVTKNKSQLFLSGYRSGRRVPCGTDRDGFKIFQKSLRDCGTKRMTFEETIRRYFEPNLQLVDVRAHDVVEDNGMWRGDLGVLNDNGAWRLYRGNPDGFASGPTGSLGNLGAVLGQGLGDVTGPSSTGANDDRLFADLITLVDNGGKKVLVARATGDGFEAPVATDAPASARRLVVGDFNGDLLTDAGLLSTVTPGTANLAVMFRQAGGWSAPADRWTGALDLDAADAFVAAGDVNGDGKADLVMRDGADGYRVAPSFASCASFGSWGPCLNVPGTGLAAATPWLASPSWALADARHTLTDFDRDGRTDVLFTTTRAGGGVRVMVLRATASGAFADAAQLWESASVPFADVTPMGMHVDPDGLGDLAMLQKEGSTSLKLFWLRSIEKGVGPATMTATQSSIHSFTWAGARPF